MLRIASLTLVIGAVLLLTWVLRPASARPHQGDAVAAPQAPLMKPLADVAEDIARLKKRMPTPAPYSKPARDPFRFGHAADESAPPPAPVVAPAPPPLPRLVAILSDTVNGAVVRRAAIGVEKAVRIVSVGEMVGALRVSAITADGVDLVDVAGATFRVPLR
jgi:hypothetical protein